MNWAHVHLMLTHIPVIGVGAILAFLLLGAIRGSREIQWASLQLFVALALLSITVYLSGSPANHQVRDLPGFTRSVIHRHSTAADFAFWSLEILGALSLGALYLYRASGAVPVRFIVALLMIGFVVLLLMGWTANLGGKIRHPEIGAAIVSVSME
ncbi:MAG TPA: hypothetical protein VFE02_19720 [Candidatus Acidoferrales bacterium]|jgi:hypothetical protein|nr:hypothetical protein [Candidatus Acidoferrales bacterium]